MTEIIGSKIEVSEEKPKKRRWISVKTQDSIIRWTRFFSLVLLITFCLRIGYQLGYTKSEDSYWVIARGCQGGKVEPREWQPSIESIKSVYFVCVQK